MTIRQVGERSVLDVDTILCGDALAQLATLPTESVQCIVTSPPYYGLRDYGTATWEGGDAGCDHVVTNAQRTPWANEVPGATSDPGKNTAGHIRPKETGGECGKCGATRIDQQIGLEQTPEQFIARLVAVFAEARRVLRSDGVCWVNTGDSYAGSPKGSYDHGTSTLGASKGPGSYRSAQRHQEIARIPGMGKGRVFTDGVKPKDLIGIPWMLAFALRADGWYLRADIIWAKPNPMPESVTDRPTKSHEYLFLLTKSPRYFYDADAIREDAIHAGKIVRATIGPAKNAITRGIGDAPNGAMRTAWGFTTHDTTVEAGRNKRSVWTVATAPYPNSHFATFPPKLIEPCILAGSRPGDVVLDPFLGSGTVAAVARRHSRSWLGIELNPAYVELAERRIAAEVQPVLWSSVA